MGPTTQDAGLKSSREFKLTEFEQPTKIRWTALSKMTILNTFDGHGFGKVLLPLATRGEEGR